MGLQPGRDASLKYVAFVAACATPGASANAAAISNPTTRRMPPPLTVLPATGRVPPRRRA